MGIFLETWRNKNKNPKKYMGNWKNTQFNTKALFANSIIIKIWNRFADPYFNFCIYFYRLDCSALVFFVQSFVGPGIKALWYHGVRVHLRVPFQSHLPPASPALCPLLTRIDRISGLHWLMAFSWVWSMSTPGRKLEGGRKIM